MVVVYSYLEDYDFYDCAYVFMYFFLFIYVLYLRLFFLDIKHMNLHEQICMQLELSGCISSYIVLHNWCMIRTLL